MGTRIEIIAPRNFPAGVTELGPFSIPDGSVALRAELYRSTTLDPTIWSDATCFVRFALEIDIGKGWHYVGAGGGFGGIYKRMDGTEGDAIILSGDLRLYGADRALAGRSFARRQDMEAALAAEIAKPLATGRQFRVIVEASAPFRSGIAIEVDTAPLANSQRTRR